MSYSEYSDVEMQDLLDALTEQVINDGREVQRLIRRSRVPASDVEGLYHLIKRLDVCLHARQPSDHYVKRLKYELTGRDERLFAQFRSLPLRAQFAAALAAVAAGFLFLLRRRVNQDDRRTLEVAAM